MKLETTLSALNKAFKFIAQYQKAIFFVRRILAGTKYTDAIYLTGWNEAKDNLFFGQPFGTTSFEVKIQHDNTKRDKANIVDTFEYDNNLSPLSNIKNFYSQVCQGWSFIDSNKTICFKIKNGQTIYCSIAMAWVMLNSYNAIHLDEWNPELFIFSAE